MNNEAVQIVHRSSGSRVDPLPHSCFTSTLWRHRVQAVWLLHKTTPQPLKLITSFFPLKEGLIYPSIRFSSSCKAFLMP